jgi:hypothetical protein
MLDAFAEATAQDGSAAAMERLDRFRRWRSQLELMRQYPEAQALLETDRVLMWRSDSRRWQQSGEALAASELGR